METKLEKWILTGLKIFLLGLLLHFFLHTFVSFELGFSGGFWSIVWLWKEILVLGGLLFFFCVWFYRQKTFSLVVLRDAFLDRWKSDVVFRVGIVSIVGVLLFSFLSTVLVNGLGLDHRLVSLKYNLFPLFVFVCGYVASMFVSREGLVSVVRFFGWMITFALLAAVLWYGMISVKPGGLKYFGYDPLSYEGQVGEAPPAAYLSDYDHGIARNQFLFERPISRGFYLIAFWPLFFVFFLQRKSRRQYWFPWMLYMGNVFLTFSRAAWGAFVLQIAILLLLTYWRHRKQILLGLLGFVFFAILGLFAFGIDDSLLDREFSDKGHISALVQGTELFLDKPLFGHGGSSVGPGSHQFGDGFNPENQFLQIMIEYGIFGFVFWVMFYLLLLGIGRKTFVYVNDHKKIMKKKDTKVFWIYVGLSVGLLGLLFEGFVLHSFADRMIIYPLMMFLGVFAGKLVAGGSLSFHDRWCSVFVDGFIKRS